MHQRRSLPGFTLVEMLVVITIIGILAAMAIPNITKARVKAKETEVKANLHSIQTSIERFFVDEGQYPHYIVGGTNAAWQLYENRIAVSNPNFTNLKDPLIAKGYMDAYPRNPFVSNGATIVVESGGFEDQAGSGDPRFGQNGLTVGNLMDDPRFLTQQTSPNQFNRHYASTRIGADRDNRAVPYPAGGRPNPNAAPGQSYTAVWWPGNFFYRAVGPVDFVSPHPNYDQESPNEVWAFYNSRFDSYILGGYGDKGTEGLDVVRMTAIQGQQLYRQPPTGGATFPLVALNNNQGQISSLPEVMGGGDANNHPYFPYLKVGTKADGTQEVFEELQYGAPDGIADGVVQVLTPAAAGQKKF